MKLYNIKTDNGIHLCAGTENGICDLTAMGYNYTMDEVIRDDRADEIKEFISSSECAFTDNKDYANVVNNPGKLVCVGLNYRAHAEGINLKVPDYPILFSKFSDSLIPHGADITIYPWETSYDYEGELVIVMGKECFDVNEEDSMDYVFGYTIGNDVSLRDAQFRSGQWLIGKAMPAFGPAGPCIVTKDEFNPKESKYIRSYVNGEMRQDGLTTEMIFDCAKIISYASKYIRLMPGDLIYTGTPSGVALEAREDKRKWLEAGDVVDIDIEGIGRLTNTIVMYKK